MIGIYRTLGVSTQFLSPLQGSALYLLKSDVKRYAWSHIALFMLVNFERFPSPTFSSSPEACSPPHFPIHLCLPLPHFQPHYKACHPLSGNLEIKACPHFTVHSYVSAYIGVLFISCDGCYRRLWLYPLLLYVWQSNCHIKVHR
jgi:hypothetical protein